MQVDITTLKSEKLSPQDYNELAKLHILCLPESLVSFFGQKYIHQFYQYISKSPFEFLLTHKNQGKIIGVCVLSLSPQTLSRRLVLRTLFLVRIPFAIYNIILHLRSQLFIQCFCMFKFYLKRRKEKISIEKNSDPEVIHIFTDLKVRNQGLGTLMLEKCEAILIQKGFNRYIIKTWDDESKPAVKFYKQKGFVFRNRFWRHGLWMQTMEKSLTSAKNTCP